METCGGFLRTCVLWLLSKPLVHAEIHCFKLRTLSSTFEAGFLLYIEFVRSLDLHMVELFSLPIDMEKEGSLSSKLHPLVPMLRMNGVMVL